MSVGEDYIGPARPMFMLEDTPVSNKRCERLIAGGSSSGMFIDVTEDGLTLNAYYTGFQGDFKYSVLRDGVVIPWEELDKIKDRIVKLPKKKLTTLDRVEKDVDVEYLKTLPIVHINKRRYYIDSEKRERRSVERPSEVWRF
jgi:hypothetical protein